MEDAKIESQHRQYKNGKRGVEPNTGAIRSFPSAVRHRAYSLVRPQRLARKSKRRALRQFFRMVSPVIQVTPPTEGAMCKMHPVLTISRIGRRILLLQVRISVQRLLHLSL